MVLKDLQIPIRLDYYNRIGNLDVEASGPVKSKKNFPIFRLNGEVIFKPLSKTKPLTTDFFAYSEVFWSYVINKYFDPNTPLYHLAYCSNIQDKYYEKGTIVKKIGTDKFTNLYEYFNQHPESTFDISEYINYCMKDYDYSMILNSEFIKNNKAIGRELSYQILLSILRADQNFHYENINLDSNNGYHLVAPLDFEFSTPFLYPDNLNARNLYMNKYLGNLNFPRESQYTISELIQAQFNFSPVSTLFKNLYTIMINYPDVIEIFVHNMNLLYKDLDSIELRDDFNFIEDCSSEYWMIGHAKYKENDSAKAFLLSRGITKVPVNKEYIFKSIRLDIKNLIDRLNYLINGMKILINNGYTDLRDMTMENLCKILRIEIDSSELALDYRSVYNKVKEYKK